MFRVLLLENDGATADSIATMLRSAGHICDAMDLGSDGLAIARVYDYDILLLDLACGSENARILRQLRVGRVQSPVLALAALDKRLRALGLEVRECLAKPFTRRELLDRVEALAGADPAPGVGPITAGMLTVDLDRGTVKGRGRPLRLTAKEYGVLALLALHKGTTLTKEQLRLHLYGGMDEPEPKIIDVFVCKLRKKLAKATGGENCIKTVWGQGYMLHDPLRANPGPDAAEVRGSGA